MQSNQTAKMSSTNAIQIKWHENAAWDAPELRSPQPCIHGAGCVFTVKRDDKILPGCCSFVHPGEEGTGRRFFPARTLPDGRVQPACVRLTGAANQFYERRGRKIPWQQWCADKGIPFTANKPGEKHAPVQRVAFGKKASIAPMDVPIAYSENQMAAFRGLAEWQEQQDARENREYRAMSPAERAENEARMKAAFREIRVVLEEQEQISRERHRAKKIINLPGAEHGMPTVVEMQPCCSNPSCGVTVFTPIPGHLAQRNPAIPAPIFFPPPLNLRPTNSSLEDDDYSGSSSPYLFTTLSRSGGCSQDCTCPTGIMCGDVRTPMVDPRQLRVKVPLSVIKQREAYNRQLAQEDSPTSSPMATPRYHAEGGATKRYSKEGEMDAID